MGGKVEAITFTATTEVASFDANGVTGKALGNRPRNRLQAVCLPHNGMSAFRREVGPSVSIAPLEGLTLDCYALSARCYEDRMAPKRRPRVLMCISWNPNRVMMAS
jgi:hypothetical protein